MAIWMGENGGIRLERSEAGPFYVGINPSDVDTGAKRFSFDRANTALITGDEVSFIRVDENGQQSSELLDFVAPSAWEDGQQHSDGQWYVSVDPVGGIRLYESWREAVSRSAGSSLELAEPSGSYRLAVEVRSGLERCLAQTMSWELNTNRDVADITSLGDGFAKNMATMISGSGRLECLFDVTQGWCDGSPDHETSVYLHQLALRQEIGANFKGVFLMKQKGCLPLWGDEAIRDEELFFACDCVISEVATAIEPGEIIRSQVQFVTTGEIQLLYSAPADYLLQETTPSKDKILQESDFGIYLETPA